MNEEFTTITPPQQNIKKPRKVFKIVLLVILILAAFAAALYAVYAWQQSEANKKQESMQSTINQLNEDKKQLTSADNDNQTNAEPATFTYTSKTGGLSLNLSASYSVIVNIDGNKGGAVGAILKVAKKDAANTLTDSMNGSVELEIDALDVSIDNQVNILKDELKNEGYTTMSVSDVTVGTQTGKLITSTPPMVGGSQTKKLYVVKSGDFFYTITATGLSQPGPEILTAVLKGIKIESEKLQ